MHSDNETLYLLRSSIKDFLVSLKNYKIKGPILEVGRMQKQGKIYDSFPELYVDSQKLFSKNQMIFMDVDQRTAPDICDDIINVERHFKVEELGAILLIHVLEHVKQFWVLPEKLASILKPGGYVFVQSPWNFRFHGPRPDCWRISDDGYEQLFGNLFSIEKMVKYNPLAKHLHPLSISVVLKKKCAG